MKRIGRPNLFKRRLWRAVERRIAEFTLADVLRCDLTQPMRDYEASDRVQIELIDPAADWKAVLPPASWNAVRRAFARGDHGWYAKVGGEFAGHVWVSRVTHRDPWSGITVRLRPDEAYTHSLLALPQFRADGVAAVLVAAMHHHLRSRGGTSRVYCWVDRNNKQSQLLLRMLFGYKGVQELTYVRLFGRWGMQVPRSVRPRGWPASRGVAT